MFWEWVGRNGAVTAVALALVLIAAVLHAAWNTCAKCARGGLPFVWVVGLVICIGYVPVLTTYALANQLTLTTGAVLWIFGSGVLKTGYSLFLQRGYRSGDFSLIYPLARGTGPLLSTMAAIAVLGERPSGLAMAGGLVIIGSIFWLTGGIDRLRELASGEAAPRASPANGVAEHWLFSSVTYGVVSGVFIAAYTLWDRHGVAALNIPPVVYDGGTAFTQLILLAPFAVRRWHEVAVEWKTKKRWIFGVALLSPVAYILVLTAMKFTPVSYVAPVREVSIAIGAFIGARFLKEANPRRRILAAAAMAAGVIALALG